MSKAQRQAVDGVLLLNKPIGMSSNHALQKAKRLLNAQKAGHTGTLDPLADGLLPLCFGNATKFSADLLDANKSYLAHIKLGVRTTTGDVEGEVLETFEVPPLTRETLDKAAADLVGPQRQIPPMYSALKRDGKPLYAYAREGVTLEREARDIEVLAALIVDYKPELGELVLATTVSKGTYIRVLADDFARQLGAGGAHLLGLTRTQVGDLSLAKAVTLEQLEEAGASILEPVDRLLMSLPALTLSLEQAQRFTHGQRLRWPAIEGQYRVYGPQNTFLGLAQGEHDLLMPVRLMA